MVSAKKQRRLSILFVFLTLTWAGAISVSSSFAASPSGRNDTAGRSSIREVQKNLQSKGYYRGQIDGLMGPQTRDAIRQYQRSEHLTVTGTLDHETASRLGVSPIETRQTRPVETGNMKAAERSVKRGGKKFGHEMKKGKPVVAGKDLGKSIGRAGKDVGKATKKAVQTH